MKLIRIVSYAAGFGLSMAIANSCGGCATTVHEKVIIHERSAAPQTTFDCNESYSSECQDLLHGSVLRLHV